MISVNVHSVATDSSQKNYFAVLTAELDGEDRWLPVRLGAAEAVSIATEINDSTHKRPGSHDLISRIIETLEGSVETIKISPGEDSMDSDITISDQEGEEFQLSARASDAVAIAVRSEAELVVSEDIIESTSEPFGERFDEAHPSKEVTRLRHQMDEAIEEEDYERAAELKPKIQAAMRQHDESLNLEEDLGEELESAFDDDEL